MCRNRWNSKEFARGSIRGEEIKQSLLVNVGALLETDGRISLRVTVNVTCKASNFDGILRAKLLRKIGYRNILKRTIKLLTGKLSWHFCLLLCVKTHNSFCIYQKELEDIDKKNGEFCPSGNVKLLGQYNAQLTLYLVGKYTDLIHTHIQSSKQLTWGNPWCSCCHFLSVC